MIYTFKCKCGNKKEIKCSMQEISSIPLKCEVCGGSMKREWCSSFIIPEHMKTENLQEMSYVKNILKKRPSGKDKIYY